MFEFWGWMAAGLMRHSETVLAIALTTATSPAVEQTATPADNPQSSWLWQFSTGPALGGVLALAAAVLAFIRLGHQVAETKRGNDETARKNGEERWWDTLKWTYAEAKESQVKDSAFRTVAAVRILDSLNQDHDKLSVQQQRAVKSILDMFGESEESEVQEAVAPIYNSFGRMSPRQYEDAVMMMLAGLNPAGAKVQHADGFVDREDIIVQTAQDTVGVLVKAGDSPAGAREANDLLRVVDDSSPSGATAGLLVSQAGMTQIGHEILQGSLKRVAVVRWQPGMSTGEVEDIMTNLLRGQ